MRWMKKKQAITKARRPTRTPTTMPAIAPGVRDLDFGDEEDVGVRAGGSVITMSLGAVAPVGGGVG